MIKKSSRTKRYPSGMAVAALVVFLAAFVIMPLGLVAYDMCLYQLCKQQLKACVDSCALAAGATVASSDVTDPGTAQNTAILTAMQMFQKNTILSNSLSTATEASALPMAPAANQAQLYFQFLDPVTRQSVPIGSTNGKIIQVTGSFGFAPVFGKTIGLNGIFPAVEQSNGGLPQLDVVLCFDISASMDDFTPVSIVNRYKGNPASGQSATKSYYNVLGQGPLYTAFQCTSPTGTAINATVPQELDGGGGVYAFVGTARGTNNGALAPLAKSSSFTDVVVNIDGTNTFSSGITVSGCYFPANNIGCLVEASRGNLESIATAQAAGVDYTTWGITPKVGYYAAYNQTAMTLRHPIADAILSATKFFTIMNNDCDVHFGLVSFSSDPGTSVSQNCVPDYSTLGSITDNPANYKANSYPSDPISVLPPCPGVPLIPTAGPAYSNYSQVTQSVQSLIAYGGTNISGALQTGLSLLQPTSQGGQGLSRSGATKAIVLFTDGLPSASSLGGDPSQDARTEALAANKAGIPIYCIGLCLVPSLQSAQTAILTDTNNSSSSGGIAGISGNGACFYQATNVAQLDAVFENVARTLVGLVR